MSGSWDWFMCEPFEVLDGRFFPRAPDTGRRNVAADVATAWFKSSSIRWQHAPRFADAIVATKE